MKISTSPKVSVSMQRAQHRQWVLKPQDLVAALKLHLLGADFRSYAQLAGALHLSGFEAHAALQRLVAARLAVEIDGRIRPVQASLRSFLIRGAPFAYPAVRGPVTIGIPTAHAVAPLLGVTPISDELPPVWPNPEGAVRGEALLPLYPGAVGAALDDPKLHELLALFDALRCGQARERELAARHLEDRLA